MKTPATNLRARRGGAEGAGELLTALSERIIGQPDALKSIVPYIQIYQAGLAPEGRPAGVFLLLGPTGTGKTRTVEVLADALHGSERNVLRIDCGEFQLDHEVAKLIGAPPGYLGHRETTPMLTQQKLNAVASERSSLSIVLLDEIEKAAPSMSRLLLGVLDRAALRLGDNTTVNFERSLIFLTSNLGARAMTRELRPDFGFEACVNEGPSESLAGKIQKIGLAAVKKRFSPEFVNRIDVVSTYQPLTGAVLDRILDLQIASLQRLVDSRLGPRAFTIEVTSAARRFLLARGTSIEYGARELKRTVHRCLVQPLAQLMVNEGVEPGVRVCLEPDTNSEMLRAKPRGAGPVLVKS